MWRERPAIEFIRVDDPRRVLEIQIGDEDRPSNELLRKILEWSQMVITLPEVNRQAMPPEVAGSFNTPTGQPGGLQLPERKTPYRAWCEIVRLDLYDGQWHCRQCGLKSWNYIMAEEDPPAQCPRCAYTGEA